MCEIKTSFNSTDRKDPGGRRLNKDKMPCGDFRDIRQATHLTTRAGLN